ncbi:MAG: isoprenylcysteine carboxylmethyltransferase family protein, partial [Anaerolineales bacterium]
SKVLHSGQVLEIKEGAISLIAGSVAALVTIIFGAEYIFAPGFFDFAYPVTYPAWLRWVGAFCLLIGILLLWRAHHHLGLSFHSLVGSKKEQTLIQSGPYRWIRHPIYTAYLLNYIGGGLLAANLVLTVIPPLAFAVLVIVRIPIEEQVLTEKFGQQYKAYKQNTGRLLPKV